MKTRWSRFEILITCLSVVCIPLAAQLSAMIFGGRISALASLSIFFLVPMIWTAMLVLFLRKRGKQVLYAAVVLAAAILLSCLVLKFNTEFTQSIDAITGYYNLEAIGFFTFFAILEFCGALVGIGIGTLFSNQIASKNDSRNL